MPFYPPPFSRYARWVQKKNLQIWTRKRLSHWLAIVLALAVAYREKGEFTQLYRDLVSLTRPAPFDLFVFLLAVATILASIWELFGNRLATSPQEIRFLLGMRSLLRKLESLVWEQDLTHEEAEANLAKFIKGFLEITSRTICAHKAVDAGLMLKLAREDKLERKMVSDRAPYPEGFKVPLPVGGVEEKDSGPGGVCFSRGRLVYMPSVKKYKEAWPLELTEMPGKEEVYKLEGMPVVCWIKAEKPEQEAFSSMLCVPVGIDSMHKTRYGILEYTAKAKDPFIDRDFMMAECFASILSQASAITAQKQKKEKTAVTSQGEKPHPVEEKKPNLG